MYENKVKKQNLTKKNRRIDFLKKHLATLSAAHRVVKKHFQLLFFTKTASFQSKSIFHLEAGRRAFFDNKEHNL